MQNTESLLSPVETTLPMPMFVLQVSSVLLTPLDRRMIMGDKNIDVKEGGLGWPNNSGWI